jgi:hypothetical protein
MEITDWFNANFTKSCFDLNLEPAYDERSQMLYIFGADIPDQKVQDKVIALIPKGQKVEFMSSLMTSTKVMINLIMKYSGCSNIMFRCNPDHEVVLEVEFSEPILCEPSSPIWTEVTRLLKADAFTKTIKYVINGEVYEPIPSGENPEGQGHNPTDLVQEEFMRRRPLPKTNSVPGKVNDDRFDYDREYLPDDIDKDVKILLETTNGVDDFLSKI